MPSYVPSNKEEGVSVPLYPGLHSHSSVKFDLVDPSGQGASATDMQLPVVIKIAV